MMYTAATAAAVDYQFRKYMANKQSLDARIRRRAAEAATIYSKSNEGLAEMKKAGSGKKSQASYALESSEQKPSVKENPPRAGPRDASDTEKETRRRSLWKKFIEGCAGCSAPWF